METRIDREGMIADLHGMLSKVWSRHNYSLSGNSAAFEFKNEVAEFQHELAFSAYCPDLRGFGLHGEIQTSAFRCGQCNKMQHGGSFMLWISDGILMGDPLWTIREELNGSSGSGWCVPCVRELVRQSK